VVSTNISFTAQGMAWGWKFMRNHGSPAANQFDLKPGM